MKALWLWLFLSTLAATALAAPLQADDPAYRLSLPEGWSSFRDRDTVNAKIYYKLDWQTLYHSPDGKLFCTIGAKAIPRGNGASHLKSAVEQQLFFPQNIKSESDVRILYSKRVKFQGRIDATEILYEFYDVDKEHDPDTGETIPRNASMLARGRAVMFVKERTLWVLDAVAFSLKEFEENVGNVDLFLRSVQVK